jgi:hypothetical protein
MLELHPIPKKLSDSWKEDPTLLSVQHGYGKQKGYQFDILLLQATHFIYILGYWCWVTHFDWARSAFSYHLVWKCKINLDIVSQKILKNNWRKPLNTYLVLLAWILGGFLAIGCETSVLLHLHSTIVCLLSSFPPCRILKSYIVITPLFLPSKTLFQTVIMGRLFIKINSLALFKQTRHWRHRYQSCQDVRKWAVSKIVTNQTIAYKHRSCSKS